MIKYYCDICEKELKTSEEHFTYILPQRVSYKIIRQGECTGAFEKTEDKGLSVCSSCRYKIAYALEKIKMKHLKRGHNLTSL